MSKEQGKTTIKASLISGAFAVFVAIIGGTFLYFNNKHDNTKPTSSGASIIDPKGGVNVGVGEMSGGTINVNPPNLTPPVDEDCIAAKSRAQEIAMKLENKIVSISNEREIINCTFWKRELEAIMNYDCEKVHFYQTKINSSFEKAIKQLNNE